MEDGFDLSGQFLYSIKNTKQIIDKGNYVVIVDAIWNQSANLDL